ncbi:hypothetical protein [Bacillus sp. XF8]|uniref:hypothetical protein n=1 Tax=Bacillus sp. XF8 TaxID=2819289 RepID=UPI001AA0534A|nr:hypothetical protein [Bacillus sp. XF8]MBO1582845.1 hypothetical protein [Bacillus sp. XF8]
MNNLQSKQELKIEESIELLKASANLSRIQVNKKFNVNEIVNILQIPQSTVSQHKKESFNG